MRNHVLLPSIQNVVAGSRCDLQLARGLTYDYIIFDLTNVTVADITNFKVKVGTKAIVEFAELATLDKINKYYSRPEKAGQFVLWFYRPEFLTEEERSLYSLGTMDVPSLSVNFDLAGSVSNPAIQAYALQRGPAPMGMVTKYREMPVTFATAGQQEIANISRTGDRISAIHLFKSDINNVEMSINIGKGPSNLIEMPKSILETVQELHGRTPQTASATHIDSALLGKVSEILPTKFLQELRVKPTLGTPGQVNTVVEYNGGYNGA